MMSPSGARRSPSKRRVFEVLESATTEDFASTVCDVAIIGLILLSMLAIVLESVPSLGVPYGPWFEAFELFSVVIFSVEYVARVWSSDADAKPGRSTQTRLAFAMRPLVLIDLLAIAPFYLELLAPLGLGLDLRTLRGLRIFRTFRLLKLSRYSESAQVLLEVFRNKREELVLTLLTVSFMLLLSSSVIYHFEHVSQPDKFGSIPAAMWWGVATLTTVGYGDVTPITPIGRMFAALVAVLGVGVFALPAGILASGFAEVFERRGRGRQLCPHCGQDTAVAPGDHTTARSDS